MDAETRHEACDYISKHTSMSYVKTEEYILKLKDDDKIREWIFRVLLSTVPKGRFSKAVNNKI